MTKKATGASPASIDQLSHSVVDEWIESEDVRLRPAQKLALTDAIVKAVPAFLKKNKALVLDQYLQSIREEERKACLDAIVAIEEPFPGFISKQRLLNIYAYPEANKKTESGPE